MFQIKWRPVLWGMGLQFVFALIILRTSQGFTAFKFIGDSVTRFLEYTDVGSAFVFGDAYVVHISVSYLFIKKILKRVRFAAS